MNEIYLGCGVGIAVTAALHGSRAENKKQALFSLKIIAIGILFFLVGLV
ncbi:hypothetical protein KAS31_01110 [Candidatus Parcubacteria bacterium]|nr:hypothetical protein [Candidatus Parcubacteria bacterium]